VNEGEIIEGLAIFKTALDTVKTVRGLFPAAKKELPDLIPVYRLVLRDPKAAPAAVATSETTKSP
jgi:hypothetical protein